MSWSRILEQSATAKCCLNRRAASIYCNSCCWALFTSYSHVQPPRKQMLHPDTTCLDRERYGTMRLTTPLYPCVPVQWQGVKSSAVLEELSRLWYQPPGSYTLVPLLESAIQPNNPAFAVALAALNNEQRNTRNSAPIAIHDTFNEFMLQVTVRQSLRLVTHPQTTPRVSRPLVPQTALDLGPDLPVPLPQLQACVSEAGVAQRCRRHAMMRHKPHHFIVQPKYKRSHKRVML